MEAGGYESVGQAVMGLKEPASGFLLAGAVRQRGAEVPVAGFADLRVDAEVAFRMRAKLAGPGVTAGHRTVRGGERGAALELLDFMFSGKPSADFIANSVIGKAIALGSPLVPIQGLDLAREEVVYEHNGEVIGTYTAAEVMGNPLNALAWLANHLAERGLALKPGDVVMSGAISKMLRPKPGDTIRARFGSLGTVSIKLVA